MGMPGPRRHTKFSEEFKATAAALSNLDGVLVRDVADALDIHPNMLSRWRKEVREGVNVAKAKKLDPEAKSDLERLRELEKKYKILQEEHLLLKKPSGLLQKKDRDLRVHRSKPGRTPNRSNVQGLRCDSRWLLRLEEAPTKPTKCRESDPGEGN